jgi:Ca2+-binding RTX toxin-like protein
MTRSFFGRTFGFVGADGVGRDRKVQPRRLQPSVDGLETRALMTGGGSVALSGAEVVVTPAPTGPNTVMISYQQVGGVNKLDVNLNGSNNDFSIAQVGLVYFDGVGLSGNDTFTNTTSVTTMALGGSGTNVFTGGSGVDIFVGGSGSNTFYAGSGYDILIGGAGPNVFNLNSKGSGMVEDSPTDTINGSTANYLVI